MSGLSAEPLDRSPVPRTRLRLRVRGAVQGVGFRPFVYRLARSLGLSGFVVNSTHGVTIEIEGPPQRLREFEARLRLEGPPRSAIARVESEPLDAQGFGRFEIRDSDVTGRPTAPILPDAATCPDCLKELLDPTNRRYRYPFTNCTNCGPRYTIILALPYDRERTTMQPFAMCHRCRGEYQDPLDRRFHAEPNACPECGPSLELWDETGRLIGEREQALETAVSSLRKGRVVAVKGIGGFHLLVDARDEEAVRRLRKRKQRDAKPFAVMAPSLDWIRSEMEVEDAAERLLLSPEAPIVLLRRASNAMAPSIAPGSPSVGMLLPYSPLHHLLMLELGFPVVATSGNMSDEPMCIDEHEALVRLQSIANMFLVHDRRIAHRADDSVARVMAGRPMLLRRGRGYAPMSVASGGASAPVMALGGHLKSTVALAVGDDIILSPHVGDLESPTALESLDETVTTLADFYGVKPEILACDMHPDYASTQAAHRMGKRVVTVQHHHAHVLAAMVDQGLRPPFLGFSWDGSGYGGDGTVWGGETLRVLPQGFERVASFRLFPLPGGEKAVREPRRSALGALFIAIGAELFDRADFRALRLFAEPEAEVLRQMLLRGLNSPMTSSVGRLFDAVAALLGLNRVSAFEGQAAMALEAALGETCEPSYPFDVEASSSGQLVMDWAPALREVLGDVVRGTPAAVVSQRFHDMLADVIVAVAQRASESRVVLTGGCFQNRYLLERAVERLKGAGVEPFWNERIPPNDGGLAVGQAVAALQIP